MRQSNCGSHPPPASEDTRGRVTGWLAFQLEVLRPPTFDQLGHVLRRAKADGRPYHIVHFDGHGMYTDVADEQPAAELALVIGDPSIAANCALNLGHAYKDLSEIRDLGQAEHWYRQSIGLRSEGDWQGRSARIRQLGTVELDRFSESFDPCQPQTARLDHLNAAIGAYAEVLGMLPDDAVADLAMTHNQLGNAFRLGLDIDITMGHYRQAIARHEGAGDRYGAAETCRNAAVALFEWGRFPDAGEYALAALRGFQEYGDGADREIQEVQGLLGAIEKALK